MDAKKKLQTALEHVQDVLDDGEFEFDPETMTALNGARSSILRALDCVREMRSIVEPAQYEGTS